MELIHQDSVVVLTSSITTTTGVSSVLADTTVTSANVSSLLSVVVKSGRLNNKRNDIRTIHHNKSNTHKCVHRKKLTILNKLGSKYSVLVAVAEALPWPWACPIEIRMVFDGLWWNRNGVRETRLTSPIDYDEFFSSLSRCV